MLATIDEGLPAWRAAADLVRAAVESLRPPRKVSVSECAELHRKIKNPGKPAESWRNSRTPYLVEPMDAVLLREVSIVALMGPSQFGKSELFLNVAGHAIKYRPADILMILPDREAAKDFAERRVSMRLLNSSPDYAAELGDTRSDDTNFEKTFRSGMKFNLVWPTPSQLSSRSVPIVMLDERDRIADDIGGEGDPVELGRNRVKFFGKDGKVLLASSPSRQDGTGIVSWFHAGDQRLWFWPCLECGDYWSPGFDADRRPTLAHLYVKPGASPEEAAAAAELICPHCGGRHVERNKAEMNARGVWLALGQSIDRDGTITGRPAANRVWSYWFHGLATPFETWGDLAAKLVAAERHFEQTGEEKPLKTVINTGFGTPYKSRADGEQQVEADDLRGRSAGFRLGEVPLGVRFLVAAVDVQGGRFSVGVVGYDEHAEGWLIDRFELRQLADNRTDIRPGEKPEHWNELLTRVVDARYPLADDPERSLGVATVAIDTGGVPGVDEHARSFWRRCRAAGVPEHRLMLVKGSNNPAAPILSRPTYELRGDGKPNRHGSRIYLVGVTAGKDLVSNRLKREEPGPGAIHFPDDLADGYFDEVTAERKIAGRWKKLRRANETLDVLVYSVAAYLRLRPQRVNWERPPGWARPMTAAELEQSLDPPAELDDADDDDQGNGQSRDDAAGGDTPPHATTPADEIQAAAPTPAAAPPARPTPARPTRRKPGGGGFVNKWR